MKKKKLAIANHLHKYEKIRLGKGDYVVFRCILSNCNHYIRAELAKGKTCLCNRCNHPMKLDKRAMRLQKPHCISCIEHRDAGLDNLAELFK